MPSRPKGSAYPTMLPCGCRAAYSYVREGKRRLQMSRDVTLIEGQNGLRVCRHGRFWILEQSWKEVRREG